MPFYDETATVRHVESKVPRCGACGLYKRCPSAKMPVAGTGNERILVVLNSLSTDDAESGRWARDPHGRQLAQLMSSVGINLMDDCWVTGAIICSKADNSAATADEVRHCRPNLRRTIEELKPVAIVLMGHSAVASVVHMDWKADSDNQAETWAGEVIPSQLFNAWLLPTFSLRSMYHEQHEDPSMHSVRETFSTLARITGRPWGLLPRYTASVECVYNAEQAADAIRAFSSDQVVAFDYETTCLKPEQRHSEIVSVAFSNGRRTVAAPWYREVAEATREVLRAPCGKVASNLKFEQRWTLHTFGHGVRNWVWDTMQASHWISQRPGITSLKFQSYVRLGQRDYDSHLKSRMQGVESDCAASVNRVREIPIGDLLLYNGMDAILELLLAIEQIELTQHPFTFQDPCYDLRPQNNPRKNDR